MAKNLMNLKEIISLLDEATRQLEILSRIGMVEIPQKKALHIYESITHLTDAGKRIQDDVDKLMAATLIPEAESVARKSGPKPKAKAASVKLKSSK